MSEYTPTTEEVREGYAEHVGLADIPAVIADVHPAVTDQENNNA